MSSQTENRRWSVRMLVAASSFIGLVGAGWTQQAVLPLDPARSPLALHQFALSTPLTEQYIWVDDAAAAAAKTPPSTRWCFRRTFELASPMPVATLYVADSGDVSVWLNGTLLLHYNDDFTRRAGLTVHALDAAGALREGSNVLTIMVGPLHGSHHTSSDAGLLAFVAGHALAAKLVPAGRGVDIAPVMISDPHWQASVASNISDDSAEPQSLSWTSARSLGPLEGNIAFLQWNGDAGMYDWPGYIGAGPWLQHFTLHPQALQHVFAGSSVISGADAQSPGEIKVSLGRFAKSENPPALTVDFGREVAGRFHVHSTSGGPIVLSAAYGESEAEALYEPFLGARILYIPPHGDAWGPKSGFRYVRVKFLSDAAIDAMDLDGIAYPVSYRGGFHSSDPLVNTIWETAAYTAHLCMQDDVWDGVKRDRARWAGDLDVSGRVISDVFGDRALMEGTLSRLIEETGGKRHVNGIAGYSALWIDTLAHFYRQTGDMDFLKRETPGMLALLHTMDQDLDEQGRFVSKPGEHVFVDWTPELHSDTPEARAATALQFLLAYREAAQMLVQAGEPLPAAQYAGRAKWLRARLRATLLDRRTNTFGPLWQTNAVAVLAGAVDPGEYSAQWKEVFSTVDQVTPTSRMISPYFGFYVLEAMTSLGHTQDALHWMREYWGGMVAEGATSFWEAYDPRWPKRDFHAGLQADGVAGYYVSLAHGWSSGPAAWLLEDVLGVRVAADGTVKLQPHDAGLSSIEGSVATAQGVVKLSLSGKQIDVDLPAGSVAELRMHWPDLHSVRVDGSAAVFGSVDSAGCATLKLPAGHHTITSQDGGPNPCQ